MTEAEQERDIMAMWMAQQVRAVRKIGEWRKRLERREHLSNEAKGG